MSILLLPFLVSGTGCSTKSNLFTECDRNPAFEWIPEKGECQEIQGVYLAPDLTDTDEAAKSKISVRVKEMYQTWEGFAQTCTLEGAKPYPSKEACDDGDMTLFNGLLCSAGIEAGCVAVAASQSDDGRFWRSPGRKGHNRGQKNSFSRDMTLGVLLYLAVSRDSGAALRWINYIQSNRKCLFQDKKGGCVKNPLLPKIRVPLVCDDVESRKIYGIRVITPGGNCIITPVLWGVFENVFTYANIPYPDLQGLFQLDSKKMRLFDEYARPGFGQHLVMVKRYIERFTGKSGLVAGARVRKLAYENPSNVFFRYVAEGPHIDLLKQLTDLCPRQKPERLHQWMFERSDSEQAWKESMGWDCMFMAKVLTKDLGIPLD